MFHSERKDDPQISSFLHGKMFSLKHFFNIIFAKFLNLDRFFSKGLIYHIARVKYEKKKSCLEFSTFVKAALQVRGWCLCKVVRIVKIYNFVRDSNQSHISNTAPQKLKNPNMEFFPHVSLLRILFLMFHFSKKKSTFHPRKFNTILVIIIFNDPYMIQFSICFRFNIVSKNARPTAIKK